MDHILQKTDISNIRKICIFNVNFHHYLPTELI